MARPIGQFNAQSLRLLDLIVVDLRQRAIASHDGPDTYFAGKLGVSTRQVRSYLRRLRDEKLVEVQSNRFNLGPGTWANKRSITPKEAQD